MTKTRRTIMVYETFLFRQLLLTLSPSRPARKRRPKWSHQLSIHVTASPLTSILERAMRISYQGMKCPFTTTSLSDQPWRPMEKCDEWNSSDSRPLVCTLLCCLCQAYSRVLPPKRSGEMLKAAAHLAREPTDS